MRAGAAARFVRGRGLLRRRCGRDRTARIAACASLDDALADLAQGPYGRDLRPGMDLASAQHAVQSALLWHLRILAGWESPVRTGPVRLLAAGFEIRNVVTHLVRLSSSSASSPSSGYFNLGSFATVWEAIRNEESPGGVRRDLSRSGWGDPGGVEPAQVLLAMRLAWARRITEQVPDAAAWARQAALLLWSYVSSEGLEGHLAPSPLRDLHRVVGARALSAGPPPPASHLWAAEARWWNDVEGSSRSMVSSGDAGDKGTVGVVGLLAADAWRTGAALGLAGRPGTDAELEALVGAGA